MAKGASETFALDLESNIAGVALEGAEALEELRDSIALDTAALGNMQKAMRQLQGSAAVDIGTFKQLRAQIAAQKATIAQSTSAYVQAGGTFKALKKPALDAEGGFRALAKGAAEAPGPLGDMGTKLNSILKLTAGGAIAGGIVAIVAAMGLLVAASLAAGASLVGYAIAMGDARRSEELRLQGLSKFRNFWAEMVPGMRRAADSSTFLQTQLDAVADSSALGRDRIGEMQAELYRAGLRSGNLQAALEGLAIAESTQGAEGAAQFKARAIGAALYGGSIKKVSDDIKARLGGIAKAQLLSLDVQQRKLHENIARLFKDIKLEPLLQAVHAVVEMFSQSTAGGRALKALIDGLVQPLIDGVGVAAPFVKRFFQGMIIAVLTFGIAILRVRNLLRDTFAGSKLLGDLDLTKTAVYLGAGAFGFMAAMVLVSVAAVAAFVGVFALAAYGVYRTLTAVFSFIAGVQALAGFLAGPAWEKGGRAITRGIAAGITGGASDVILAITSLAGDALKAFKLKLGIASPSRAAFKATLEVPRGSVNALKQGGPMIRNAARDMAAAADDGMKAGFAANDNGAATGIAAPDSPKQGAASAATAIHVVVEAGAIVVSGTSDPSAAAEEALMKLEDRIVHAARAMGGGM